MIMITEIPSSLFKLQGKVLLDYMEPQMIGSINNEMTNKCKKRP